MVEDLLGCPCLLLAPLFPSIFSSERDSQEKRTNPFYLKGHWSNVLWGFFNVWLIVRALGTNDVAKMPDDMKEILPLGVHGGE
jgi:hypothetical protein